MILLIALISLIVVISLMPKWISVCKRLGLLWEDMNKPKHPRNVASSGGLIVVMGFVLSILLFIAIRTFVYNEENGITINILALLSVILIFAIIGLIDDLLGWRNGGLSIKLRLFLAFVASIPLVVINAGVHSMGLPFLGNVNFGLLYPLLIIPLGIAGASTVYNFLAGFNGLEAGQGIIIISFLSFIAYSTGSVWLAITGLCMVAALIGFLLFNFYPAKVFPGDILTYAIGALIASMAILGNFEKIAVFVFIPYIIEMVLKLRGGLKKHSFGKPVKNGLEMPYKKIYGLTHFSIWFLKKFKNHVTEQDVVYLIWGIQILFCLLAILIL
ncbi:MAG: glycosyl transferase family 4 [Candidatus Nanoarchaeia archaeon]